MIIQCEKCLARFRLDDSRITNKGVKVRCTKCKNVFTVRKDEPIAELFEPIGGMSGTTTSVIAQVGATIERSDDKTPGDVDFFETSSLNTSDIMFGSNESLSADIAETPSAPAIITTTEDEVYTSIPDSVNCDLKTDSSHQPAVPEVSSDTISFDFFGENITDKIDKSNQNPSGEDSGLFSLDAFGDTAFEPGIIETGDERTLLVTQEGSKPANNGLLPPLLDARDVSTGDESGRSFPVGGVAIDHQELPPLAIASRRKHSPIFTVLIAVIALLLISGLGYIGYSSLFTPKETAPLESGKIGLRTVKSAFIENDKAGELLVISGEAINEYPKPRATLQVKVTIFDSMGQSITTKTAYCGNPLTSEQLKSQPLDKIEAAMANQFGDSLVNMEVAPGRTIPFVVVLANLPTGAKDFTVQPAGSTVATGKQ